jgi:hypothetical protein
MEMVEALPSDSQLKSLLSLFTHLRVTGGEVGQVSKDAQKKDDLTALVSKDSPEKNALPVLTEIVEESPSDGLLQPNKRHFNDTYWENIIFADGSVATLRLVRPADHNLFVEGFSRLSSESRYYRFCAAKNRLSEKEIRYFTDVDQEAHFVIGAVRQESDGHEVGIGVGRFIRKSGDQTRAEPAIVVTDDAQRLGLVYLLGCRLVAAARERGVERFNANVLGSNDKVIRMMKENPDIELHQYGSEIVALSNLPSIDPKETWTHLREHDKDTNTCK